MSGETLSRKKDGVAQHNLPPYERHPGVRRNVKSFVRKHKREDIPQTGGRPKKGTKKGKWEERGGESDR